MHGHVSSVKHRIGSKLLKQFVEAFPRPSSRDMTSRVKVRSMDGVSKISKDIEATTASTASSICRLFSLTGTFVN